MKQPPTQLRVLLLLVCTGLFLHALPCMAIAAGDDNAAEPLGLSPTTSSVPLGISTEGELRELLLADQGGTVTLTGDILIEENEDTYKITKPITVEMEDYGIGFDTWARLSIEGPVCFTGSGAVTPLFTIDYWQVFELFGGSITATGDHAVAVCLMNNADLFEPYYSTIAVTGSESVAVQGVGGRVNVMLADIRAAAGSFAVEASVFVEEEDDDDFEEERTDGIALYLCRIQSEGNAIKSYGGEVNLYGCKISPSADLAGARILPIRAKPADNGIFFGNPFYPIGAEVPLPDELCFGMYWEGGCMGSAPTFPVSWQTEDACIDTSEAGEFTYKGKVQLPFDDLAVENLYDFEMPVGIYDPAFPYLAGSFLKMDCVFFTYALPEETTKVWLMVSEGGEEWSDVKVIDSSWNAYVDNDLELHKSYYYRLRVCTGDDVLFSNILKVILTEYDAESYPGGDRDGDWNNPGTPPNPTLPPTDPSDPLPPPITPSDPTQPPTDPSDPTPPPTDPPDDDDTGTDDGGGIGTGSGPGTGGSNTNGGPSRRDGYLPREEPTPEAPVNPAPSPPAAPAPAGITAFAATAIGITDSPDPAVPADTGPEQTQQSKTDSSPALELDLEPDVEPAMSDEPAAPDEPARTTAGSIAVSAACVIIAAGGAFTFRRFRGRWRK